MTDLVIDCNGGGGSTWFVIGKKPKMLDNIATC